MNEWGPHATSPDGLLELVRYRFECSGSNDTDWILFRMLPAVWFDAVSV